MKITFKTVANKSFSLEVNDSDTIANVKKKIEDQGEYSAEGMKLVHRGEMLKDDATVKETGVQETDFVVVVAKKVTAVKKKPTPAPTTTTPTPQTQSTPQPQPQQQPVPMTTPTTAHTTPAPTQPQPQQQQTGYDQNRIVTGDSYQQTVQSFVEMGFDKDTVEACMRAAFNNPERALDYITNGIPEGLQQLSQQRSQQTQQQLPENQMPVDEEGLYDEEEGGDFDPNNPLAALLQQQQGGGLGDISQLFPHFNQLRAAIQQNPALLQPILQRIAQTSPQLYQIIQQNPQEFIRLLNEAPPSPQTGQQQGGNTQNPLGALGAMGGGVGATPPGTIFVTPQEKQAIDELVSLGFSRMAAAQAYFACDKNQELAANFLLENQYNDEDVQDFSQFGGGNNNQGGDNNQGGGNQ